MSTRQVDLAMSALSVCPYNRYDLLCLYECWDLGNYKDAHGQIDSASERWDLGNFNVLMNAEISEFSTQTNLSVLSLSVLKLSGEKLSVLNFPKSLISLVGSI